MTDLARDRVVAALMEEMLMPTPESADRVRAAREQLVAALEAELAEYDERFRTIDAELGVANRAIAELRAKHRRYSKTVTDIEKEIAATRKFLDPPEPGDDDPPSPSDDLKCPECDKPCQNAAGLGAHRRAAHGIAGKRPDLHKPTEPTAKEIAANRPPSAQVRPLRSERLNLDRPGPLKLDDAGEGRTLPYWCDTCTFETKHQADLLGHVRGSHNRENLTNTERLPHIQTTDSQEAK